jgi:hypothetical protein
MRGLTIADTSDGFLTFDLFDILELLHEQAVSLSWTCSAVECVGETADKVHALSDSGHSVRGADLSILARGITQTIDGVFVGHAADGVAVLRICAVDSTSWDIFADEDVLNILRARFSHTKPFPLHAG